MEIIEKELNPGQKTLSEYDSKKIISSYQIPVAREILVGDRESLFSAVREIGYPVVLKGCSSEIMHKTEKGLIRVDIRDDNEAEKAFDELYQKMNTVDGKILVQEMVRGTREILIGMSRDHMFGPCVMFGLGGIFAETLRDISLRVAPLELNDALEMMAEIKGHMILEAIRGMKAVDKYLVADILIKIGKIGLENENIKEIDINPIIITSDGTLAVVDALVVFSSN